MATTIDELIVAIGLDSSKFTKGQREAIEQFRKSQSEMLKGGREVETVASRSNAALSDLTGVALKVFSVFTAGKGLYDFTVGLTQANAEVGRLSRSTGVSVSDISKWQNAARLTGGDAAAMAGNITNLKDAFTGLSLGQISPTITLLRSISTAGGHVIESTDGVNEALVKLSANLKDLEDRTPGEGGYLARLLGLDAGTTDLLLRGPNAVKAILDDVYHATKRDADEFGELERRWNKLLQAGEQGGRRFLSQIPAVSDTLAKTPGEVYDSAKKQFLEEYEKNGFWGAVYNLTVGDAAQSTTSKRVVPGTDDGKPFADQRETEAFIRAEAARNGINPDVAVKVWESEGKYGVGPNHQSTVVGPNGREQSYGPFQLYMNGGLGNRFKAETGLDPTDPNTEREQVRWSLAYAAKNGWSSWHGWRGAKFAGIGQGSAGQGGNTEITVNGGIQVQAGPQATGAQAGEAVREALVRQSKTSQSNTGQQ